MRNLPRIAAALPTASSRGSSMVGSRTPTARLPSLSRRSTRPSDQTSLPRSARRGRLTVAYEETLAGAKDDNGGRANRLPDGPESTSRSARSPSRPDSQTGSRALLRPAAVLRLWLQPLDATFIFHQLESFHQLQPCRACQLPEALDLDLPDRSAVELVHGTGQHGPVRRSLCRLLPYSRINAGDPARPK